MIGDRFPSIREWAIVAGVFAALVVTAAAWLAVDRTPPEWDHANHLQRAVACHRSLSEPGHDGLAEIIAESSFYPPIVTCAAGLLYFALPMVPLTAQAVMWAFLVVGALAVFGLWFSLLEFLLQPFANAISRRHEFDADAFVLRSGAAAGELREALLKLREKSRILPLSHPLYSRVYHSHPPLLERFKALEAVPSQEAA